MTRVFKHKLAKPNFEKTYGLGLGTTAVCGLCPLQTHITCELYDPTVPIYESNLDQQPHKNITRFSFGAWELQDFAIAKEVWSKIDGFARILLSSPN